MVVIMLLVLGERVLPGRPVALAVVALSIVADGGLLMLGSSVYRKRGYMYRKFRELHGNDDTEDIVWFAPSSVMNPSLPANAVDKAMEEDAADASSLVPWSRNSQH